MAHIFLVTIVWVIYARCEAIVFFFNFSEEHSQGYKATTTFFGFNGGHDFCLNLELFSLEMSFCWVTARFNWFFIAKSYAVNLFWNFVAEWAWVNECLFISVHIKDFIDIKHFFNYLRWWIRWLWHMFIVHFYSSVTYLLENFTERKVV